MSKSMTRSALAGLIAVLMALLMMPAAAFAADLAAQPGDALGAQAKEDAAPWTDWADSDVIFTVYKQKGDDERVVAKEFTKAEMVQLAQANDKPASYLFAGKGKNQVVTATEYVTYEQLLDVAGVPFYTGMTMQFSDEAESPFTSQYVYQDLNSDLLFFPAWDGTNRVTEGAKDAPLIVALKWDTAYVDGSTNTTASQAAAEAQENAYHKELRNISGWKESYFTEQDEEGAYNELGGRKFVNGIKSLTVIEPAFNEFTVYKTVGAVTDEANTKVYNLETLSPLAVQAPEGVGFLFSKNGWQVGVTTNYIPIMTLLKDAYGSDFALDEDTTLIATASDGFSSTLSFAQLTEGKYFFPATTASAVDATDPKEVGTVLALNWATSAGLAGTASQAVKELAASLSADAYSYRIFTGMTEADYLAGKNNGGNRFATGPVELAVVKVQSINADSVTVEGIEPSYTYTGEAIEPWAGADFAVKDGDVTLMSYKKRWDYRVSADGDTVNVGTVTVKIAGQGAYKDTKEITYTIEPADLSTTEGIEIAEVADQAFTGSAVCPAIRVSYNGAQLVEGADYTVEFANNTALGEATATTTGKGNFTGSKAVTFNIKPSVASATIGAIPAQTYTGKALTPAVSVSDEGKTLVEGTDYAVEYANNTNAGTANVTIVGMGDYAGTATANFTISKAANTTFKASAKTVKAKKAKKTTVKRAKAFTASGAKGAVTYKRASGNKKIAVAANGKVTVKKGLKKGTYKVKVKVTDAGNANFLSVTKTVTLKVKVK